MQTFLNQVAHHIYSNHTQNLESIGIVVPTRRSAFFLLQELANVTEEAILSPDVMAIDDFAENATHLQIEDPVHLMLELYETFREIDPTVTFERFMGWAAVLMSDLDKLDQYLVDTKFLFEYLSEAQSMQRWSASMPEGKTLEFHTGTQQYFSLFQNLKLLYEKFRQRLSQKGKAYRGMIYRQLAESDDIHNLTNNKYTKLYFVGFNAFTEAEKKIIQYLVKLNKAEVLWDTDEYYMSENENMEAGKTLREYKSSKLFGDWNWTGNHLLSSEKEIKVYGVPNNSLQTKVAGQILQEITSADDPENVPITAIVLADENLLVPMLHSLDENIKDLNVTMGLSMRNSLLYTLIDSIFELQQDTITFKNKKGETIRAPKFSHHAIKKILNHPFIRHYENIVLNRGIDEPSIIQKTLSEIAINNKVFLSTSELLLLGEDHELFKILFTHWNKNQPLQVINSFYSLIDLLRSVYKEYAQSLETEYLYLFYTLLKQFEKTLSERPDVITFRTMRSFLYELIRQTSIPFSGEPISNLQILGMLETRALDFERLIIISANEGILPKAKRQNSLIPFDALQAVGLPTYLHQEAVMSYHFYRLIQRSKEIHLLYTNTPSSNSTGEKSRFIMQLEHELASFNPGIKIRNKTVVFEKNSQKERPDVIPKDEKVILAIQAYFSGKGLYPTHLNELIRCPMQFYFKHIVGIQEKQQIEEELGMDKIGTWLHQSMEEIDQKYFIQGQDPSEIEVIAILKNNFELSFKGYITDQGLNRIYYQIGEQQVLAFIRNQINSIPRRQIIATEQALRTQIQLVLQGNHTTVNVGGKIDRIEVENSNTLYIMDYKTGGINLTGISKLNKPEFQDEMIKTDGDLKMGYVRQLWLYQYLVYKKMLAENGMKLNTVNYSLKNYEVKSGFYSFRKPKELIANPLNFINVEDPIEFIEKSDELLTDILDGLLDPEIPFVKTDDLKICEYCDFKAICGRL